MQGARERELWRYLRERGITEEEELNEAISSMNKLNISCMTEQVYGQKQNPGEEDAAIAGQKLRFSRSM